MSSAPGTEENFPLQQFAMRLSLAVGFFMLATKTFAYWLTGSAAILSDAAESIVHVVAVSFAAYSLRLSVKPADRSHLYGHDKISFFSAGFEGAMIMIAAFYIIYVSIEKWISGLRLEHLGTGTGLTLLAALINGGLGFYLVNIGNKKHSLILEANGKHVLTDCWTSLRCRRPVPGDDHRLAGPGSNYRDPGGLQYPVDRWPINPPIHRWFDG